MKIAKIKNKYMYNDNKNKNGFHYYILDYDRHTKSYTAYQLTHLYSKDVKKFNQLNKGKLCKLSLSKFETPSALKKNCYKTNTNNEKITLKSVDAKVIYNTITKDKAQIIRKFLQKK